MVIESVDIVVAALSAGATAGVTDTAKTAVKDAYQALKSLTRSALQVNKAGGGESGALAEDGKCSREQLMAALTAASPATRAEVVAAARRVLELVGHTSVSPEKYRIDVHGNQGVQVGEGNVMTLNFGL